MNKIIKHIPLFLLLLAGLLVSVHMIIPHDHHQAELSSDHGDSCPVSDGKSKNHHSFPVHCHAFNDLASEKVISYVVKDNIHTIDVLVCLLPDSFVFDSYLKLQPIYDSRDRFTDFLLLEYSPFRAPPSLI